MTGNEHSGPRTIEVDPPEARVLLAGQRAQPGNRALDGDFAGTPVVARLATELDAGSPVLTCFDPELTDAELRALLLATAAALGRLVPQDTMGNVLVDVRDTRPVDGERARGYQDNRRMLLHTDPTEVLAMLCLHEAPVGGGTLLRQAQDVFQQLDRADPTGTSLYFQNWRWTLPGGSRGDASDDSAFVCCPVLARQGHHIVAQYGSQLLRAGLSDGECRARLTALDAFDSVANDPQRCAMLTLKRGQCLWLNNYHTLHGRNAFVDGHRTRHLVRAWLWRHDGPGHPAAFEPLARVFGG